MQPTLFIAIQRFRMKKTISTAFAALMLFSCGQPHKEVKQADLPKYFDIAGYFNAEANRLQKLNATVYKQVTVKGKTEVKKVKIKDWHTELAYFINADINKSAWRGEFSVTESDTGITYVTKNPKVTVKKVELLHNLDKVVGVKIFKSNENALYNAVDTLIYLRDSVYIIKNQQKIKLLEVKNYEVIGKFD